MAPVGCLVSSSVCSYRVGAWLFLCLVSVFIHFMFPVILVFVLVLVILNLSFFKRNINRLLFVPQIDYTVKSKHQQQA